MSFTKATLVTAINNLAAKGKIFSNESQFQFDLAWELRGLGYDVEMEVLSVNCMPSKFAALPKGGKEKYYTDIVVKDDDGSYIAIELKYKTPNNGVMLYTTKSGSNYVFPQGAENIGSYLYWKDVERLEELVNGRIPLNFDKDKKIARGYAVLLTNAKKYWDKGAHRDLSLSLAREFYPIDVKSGGKKFSGKLCYYVGVSGSGTRIKGGWGAITHIRIVDDAIAHRYYPKNDDAKEHYPIKINNSYVCEWKTYLAGLTCKLLNGNTEPKGDEFKYLILEIKAEQQKNELS